MRESNGRSTKIRLDLRWHGIFINAAAVLFAANLLLAEGEDPWSVKSLFDEQHRLGRKLSVQDAYKLLHQESFGPGHLLADTAVARRSLFEELAVLDTTVDGDPLLERISTTGSAVRVNLRPFKRLGLSADSLLSVLIHSSMHFALDTARFTREWTELLSLIRYGLLPPLSGDLSTWEDRVQKGDLATVHHSPEYVRAYSPAYRVVLREEFFRTFRRNF